MLVRFWTRCFFCLWNLVTLAEMIIERKCIVETRILAFLPETGFPFTFWYVCRQREEADGEASCMLQGQSSAEPPPLFRQRNCKTTSSWDCHYLVQEDLKRKCLTGTTLQRQEDEEMLYIFPIRDCFGTRSLSLNTLRCIFLISSSSSSQSLSSLGNVGDKFQQA